MRERPKGREERTSQKGDSDVSVKKDIIAAITFLATGLLFFVVQLQGTEQSGLSQDESCVMPETVLVGETPSPQPTPANKDPWSRI
jgi:hypothetical protein